MPVYEFRDRCNGEVLEEVFLSWRDAPQEVLNERTGCVADRILSRIQLGVVVDGERARERELAKQGIVRYERGMHDMARRARSEIRRKQDEARGKIIAETLSAF